MSLQATEAETAFISAAIIDSASAVEHLDMPPEAFQLEWAREAYGVIREQITAGRQCDSITVAQQTGQRDLLRLPAQYYAPPSSIPEYARMIRQAYKARQVSEVCRTAQESLHDGSDPDEIASRVMSSVTDLSRSAKGWEHSAVDLAKSATDRVLAAMDRRSKGESIGVPFGMRKLDRSLGGMHPGHLVIVGARPKMGKTAWANTVALNATASGHHVGFISAEMPAEQITDRWMAALTGYSYQSLRTGDLPADVNTSDRLRHASEQLSRRPLWLMDQPACGIGDVLRQARAWVVRHGIEVLIVDHLLRLRTERHDRRDLEMSDMVRQLKTLAGELGICVVLLSQLNRGVEKRVDKRPMMSDLREAGAAEEEADAVLMLYRDAVYNDDSSEHEAEILIEANRHGPTGFVQMHWSGEQMLWSDPDLVEIDPVLEAV